MSTLSTTASRALLSTCERLGLDTAGMLQRAGVERSLVEDPDGRIPSARAGALWAEAYRCSGDENLALHVAEATPRGAYRVMDVLLEHAPTVGQGLTRVAQYFRLVNSALELPVTVGRTQAGVGAGCPPGPASRASAEYTLATLVVRTRDAAGGLSPARVEFAFPPPEDAAEHARVFGCEVRFGCAESRLVLPRAEWDRVPARADGTLFDVLDAHARLLLAGQHHARSLDADVQDAIRRLLHQGHAPSVSRVARLLALSSRTLQRRLRVEGHVFQDLLDGTRLALAHGYLRDDNVSLSDVAFLLGFADQSAFTRAFRRWTGSAPGRVRRRGPGG